MKILIAEDERDLANALKRVLEFSKYEVDLAYNGLEAFEMAEKKEYDLVISDVMMPKMDGFELTKSLRDNNYSNPILLLTARGETDDKVLGLDSGADDYLTKPFQVKELLARIRALLRRKGDFDSEVNEFGDITLEKNTFELKCNNKSTRLTNKEYKMIEVFMKHPQSLLSTERLMDLVWDLDSEAEINVVWAYISALRKKLSSIGSKYTIEAVRGVGYRLGVRNDKKA